jgi:hypothetical protein
MFHCICEEDRPAQHQAAEHQKQRHIQDPDCKSNIGLPCIQHKTAMKIVVRIVRILKVGPGDSKFGNGDNDRDWFTVCCSLQSNPQVDDQFAIPT